MLSHLATFGKFGMLFILEVHLDDEVHVTKLTDSRGGRVGPDDELAIDLGREVDMLPHWVVIQ